MHIYKKEKKHIVTYTLLAAKGPPVIVGMARMPSSEAIQRRTRPVLTRTPLMSVSNRVEVTAPGSAAATVVVAATMLMGDWRLPVSHTAAPASVFHIGGLTAPVIPVWESYFQRKSWSATAIVADNGLPLGIWPGWIMLAPWT